MSHRAARVLVAALAIVLPAAAQEDFFRDLLIGDAAGAAPSYDPAIPTPAAALGRDALARPALAADLVRYFEAVAAASDRVVVERYGSSLGGRPLVVAYVSDPANLRRRAEIAAGNAPFARPGEAAATRPAAAQDPVVIYVGMGVHGDEASGGDAALALLFHLVADRRPGADARLRNVLVAIDPAQNPDGRDRFVVGARDRAVGPPDAEPTAFEHHQPWPGGRFNGNLFDLNRDWFFQTQPESRARLAMLFRLRPHVVLDVHEMGSESTYFFAAPPAGPKSPFKGEKTAATVAALGAAIRRSLDAKRVSYFTGDVYPADFPGYGGAFPEFLGAAAMTFEQGTAAGVRYRRQDGTVVAHRDATFHHAAACLAVIEAAAADRAGIRARAAEHVAEQTEARDDPAVYVLRARGALPAEDVRLARLAAVLRRVGIAFEETTAAAAVEAAPVGGGAPSRTTFAAGSLVVRSAQAARPLVRALFDPRVGPDAAFAAAEADRLRRRRPGEIYDVTAWCLPLLFGVDAYATGAWPADVALRPSALGVEPASTATDAEAAPSAATGGFDGPLLASARRQDRLRVLAAWLRDGVRVRVATTEFAIGDRVYEPGTLVVLPEANADDDRASAAAATARRFPSAVERAPGASATRGPDLGGPRVKAVRPPRIVLAFGAPTEPTSAGGLRWFLTEELGFPFSCVAVDRPISRALVDADVLVLPDGAADAYERALPPEDVKAFLAKGGVVVAIKRAAHALARPACGVVALKPPAADDPFADLKGPIVRARLDADHWITRGGDATAFALLRGRGLGVLEGEGWSVAASVAAEEDAVVSGFAPPESVALVRGTPLIATRRAGAGMVVLFGEDPSLRGAGAAWFPALANAIVFGPTER